MTIALTYIALALALVFVAMFMALNPKGTL
jgi:hypothetical protein